MTVHRAFKPALFVLTSGFAATLALTACGGDAADGEDTTTTTTTTTTPTTTVETTVETTVPPATTPAPGQPAPPSEGDGTAEIPVPDIPSPPAIPAPPDIPSPPAIPAPPAIPSPPPIPGAG